MQRGDQPSQTDAPIPVKNDSSLRASLNDTWFWECRQGSDTEIETSDKVQCSARDQTLPISRTGYKGCTTPEAALWFVLLIHSLHSVDHPVHPIYYLLIDETFLNMFFFGTLGHFGSFFCFFSFKDKHESFGSNTWIHGSRNYTKSCSWDSEADRQKNVVC